VTEAEGVARVYSRWEQVLEGSAGKWLCPLTGTTQMTCLVYCASDQMSGTCRIDVPRRKRARGKHCMGYCQ